MCKFPLKHAKWIGFLPCSSGSFINDELIPSGNKDKMESKHFSAPNAAHNDE